MADVDPPPPPLPAVVLPGHENFDSQPLLTRVASRLAYNKAIHDRNDQRIRALVAWGSNPGNANPPDAVIEVFSVFLEDELTLLSNPSLRPAYSPSLYPDVLALLETRPAIPLAHKRAASPNPLVNHKRARISDDSLQPMSMVPNAFVEFPSIYFVTHEHDSLPLPFFTSAVLTLLSKRSACITRTFRDDNNNSHTILDIPKFQSSYGTKCKELNLSYTELSLASERFIRFVSEWNVALLTSTFSTTWTSHFTFFLDQENSVELYDFWKIEELQLRQSLLDRMASFNATIYSLAWERAKNASRLHSINVNFSFSNSFHLPSSFHPHGPPNFQPPMHPPFYPLPPHPTGHPPQLMHAYPSGAPPVMPSGPPLNPLPPPSQNMGFQFPSNATAPTTSQPFPANPPTAPTCLICGREGHTAQTHIRLNYAMLFDDGSRPWVQVNQLGRLVGPDGREVCINYNILKNPSHSCTHGPGRLDLCTFCGNQHPALSWTCRPRPTAPAAPSSH